MAFHYFKFGAATAVVQNDEQAQKFEAAGWVTITREEFREGWKRRDGEVLARIAASDAPDTRHTIVGALPGKEYPKTETGV